MICYDMIWYDIPWDRKTHFTTGFPNLHSFQCFFDGFGSDHQQVVVQVNVPCRSMQYCVAKVGVRIGGCVHLVILLSDAPPSHQLLSRCLVLSLSFITYRMSKNMPGYVVCQKFCPGHMPGPLSINLSILSDLIYLS